MPYSQEPLAEGGTVTAAKWNHVQEGIAAAGEATVNVKESPYNLKGDNSTDDSAGLNAAIEALSKVSPHGGRIIFPNGRYVLTAKGLEATKATTGITLEGQSGRDGQDIGGEFGAGTQLLYTGAGAAGFSAFDFRKCFGLTVNNIEFVTTSKPELVVNMEGAKVCNLQNSRITVGGTSPYSSTTSCLNINGIADSCNFFGCTFSEGLYGVLGGTEAEAEQVSSMHLFYGCTFLSNQVKHILNAGPRWSFMGCTFEQLRNNKGEEKASNAVGCYANQGTRKTEGLSFIACSIGDGPTAKGNQIEFQGKGLTIIGGCLAVCEKAVVLGAKTTGVIIQGVELLRLETALEIGAECARLTYAGNSWGGSGTEIVNPTNATGSILQAGAGGARKTLGAPGAFKNGTFGFETKAEGEAIRNKLVEVMEVLKDAGLCQ
jgi:hypothetical protein